MSFHRGRDVIDLPPGVVPEGLEFSPKMKALLLSSGAALYVSLVGLVVVIHIHQHMRTHGNPQLEFFVDRSEQPAIEVQQRVGAVKVQRG